MPSFFLTIKVTDYVSLALRHHVGVNCKRSCNTANHLNPTRKTKVQHNTIKPPTLSLTFISTAFGAPATTLIKSATLNKTWNICLFRYAISYNVIINVNNMLYILCYIGSEYCSGIRYIILKSRLWSVTVLELWLACL